MYIVADIGGSKMRVAASDDLTELSQSVVTDTPQHYEDGLAQLVDTVHRLAKGQSLDGVAIGIAGALSRGKGVLESAQHLRGWEGKAFSSDVSRAVSSVCYLENDTALVGLGEAVFGAGKGASIMMYVTVSTGVNGVRIVEGKIGRSAQGFEIGGQYLDTSGALTLEELVSGTAIHKRFGKNPKELGKDAPVWEELAGILAVGVHNSILHWSPERVVLGGSMFNEIGISVERVDFHVRQMMKKFRSVPDIVHSELGDLGGLHGGLARLRQA